MPGFYSLYVGGDFAGTRLNEPVADRLALGEVGPALEPLFSLFAAARVGTEGFGDLCHRLGHAAVREAIASHRKQAA